ncbi:hypothetical protein PPL_03096 [Heterostelium album PN500]|uniref:Uncharacterized protein n=1 Tax=Heterostelium pallidum (strain ATCC 26659 / Pp 5 / PN500) TaxID=670386 RepID=D3B3X5_HETP5|nr:hypothetical protein PPL_03096 [Heterostelium album PN500]EFA84023.1 hypothetical protein PPL_03096 [Heterostelium album PN500]|eukprot:XP_020436140.1 hypothetical protein PPL_03096 [Heterostelium album PN500]
MASRLTTQQNKSNNSRSLAPSFNNYTQGVLNSIKSVSDPNTKPVKSNRYKDYSKLSERSGNKSKVLNLITTSVLEELKKDGSITTTEKFRKRYKEIYEEIPGATTHAVALSYVIASLQSGQYTDRDGFEKTRLLSSLVPFYTSKEIREFGITIDNNAWNRAIQHVHKYGAGRLINAEEISNWRSKFTHNGQMTRKQRTTMLRTAVEGYFNMKDITEESSKNMRLYSKELDADGKRAFELVPIKNLALGNINTCFTDYLKKSEVDQVKYPLMGRSAFYSFVPDYVREMKNRTDMCPMCVQYQALESKRIKFGQLSDQDHKLFEILTIHKMFVQQRKNDYLTCKNELKSGECIILCDFKENISLGKSKVQVSHEFYQQPARTFFGMVLFYKQGDKLKIHYYDCLSQVLNHCSTFAISCLDKLINDPLFTSLNINKITFWCDNARHFKSNEILSYMHTLSKLQVADPNTPNKTKRKYLVELNTFAPYHGKSECDQHFSMVSRAIADKSSFKDSIYTDQDVINAIKSTTDNNNYQRTYKLTSESEKEAVTIKVTVEIHNPKELKQKEIKIFPGFTEYHRFQFLDNRSMRANKHYIKFMGGNEVDKNDYLQIFCYEKSSYESTTKEEAQSWKPARDKAHTTYLNTMIEMNEIAKNVDESNKEKAKEMSDIINTYANVTSKLAPQPTPSRTQQIVSSPQSPSQPTLSNSQAASTSSQSSPKPATTTTPDQTLSGTNKRRRGYRGTKKTKQTNSQNNTQNNTQDNIQNSTQNNKQINTQNNTQNNTHNTHNNTHNNTQNTQSKPLFDIESIDFGDDDHDIGSSLIYSGKRKEREDDCDNNSQHKKINNQINNQINNNNNNNNNNSTKKRIREEDNNQESMDNQKHHKSTHVNSQTPIQSPSQTPIQTPSQTPIQTPIPTQSQTPIQTPSQSPIQTPTQTPLHTPIQHNTTVQSTEQSKPAKEIVVIFEIDNNYNSQIQDYRQQQQQQQINYLQQLSQTLQQQSPPQSEAAASNDVEMTSHEDPIMEQVEETDDAMEIDRFCIPYEKIKDQLNTAEEDENMNNAGDFLSNWPSLRELIIRIPCLTAIADYGQLFSTLLIKNPLSNLVNSYKECDLSRFYLWSSYYIDSATIFKNKIEDWQSERFQLISTIQGIDRNSRSHIIFEKLIESFITLINMSVPVFFDLSVLETYHRFLRLLTNLII